MPRRRRHDRIHEYKLSEIERQSDLLRGKIRDAQLGLTPFRPHYDALSELERQLTRALNLLHDLPADHERLRGTSKG